jgi:hypothetical protein
MSLPKNFQETVNLTNRVNALNNLTFYNFTYNIKLTDKFLEEIHVNEELYNKLEDFLGSVRFNGNKTATGETRVSALNKEQSQEKFDAWLTKAVDSGVIDSFEVTDILEKTFNDELNELGLNNFLQ